MKFIMKTRVHDLRTWEGFISVASAWGVGVILPQS